MKEKFYATSVKIAEETERIIEVAEKLGMVLPSTHTALFQSVYSPIDSPNLNGVILAKDAVEKALPGLISAQSNLEHLGQGFMTGIILDAFINDSNEIEIIFSFAKNLYPDEYLRAIELMQTGDLSVSFELLAERESQEHLENGDVRIHEIDFQGVGLLLDNPPAYPGAKVFKFAKECKERLATIPSKELICASQVAEKCDKILATEHDDPIPLDEILWTTITTRVDRHIHVVKIDIEGNGESKGTFGDNEESHVHKIVNYQIQAKAGHAHRLIEELLAKRKEQIQANKWSSDIFNKFPDSSFAVIEPAFLNGKTGNILARHLPFKTRDGRFDLTNYRIALDKVNEILPVTDSITVEELRKQAKEELDKFKEDAIQAQKKQGGVKSMTEEQKQLIVKLREELGDFAKDVKDEDLLNETVVAELRKEKEEKAKTEANEKKSDLEKANDRITELEAKIEELENSLEAKGSEIESVRENAEKIGQTKTQLKDNDFAKDFSDEDYLDDEKIAKAIQDQEDSQTVAERKEELKDNEYVKDFKDEDYLNEDKVELAKVKAEKDELAKTKDKKTAKKENDDMNTGASNDNDEGTPYEKVIANLRQKNKETYKSQTVYERKK